MDTAYNDFMDAADSFLRITDEFVCQKIVPEGSAALDLKTMYDNVINLGLQVRPAAMAAHMEDVTDTIVSCGYRADSLRLTAK